MHIHKCGGTSIHSLMDANFPYKKIVEKAKDVAKEKSKEIDIKNYDSYHIHMNIINRIPDDFTCFTVLREPKSRLLSLINHWLDWSEEEIENNPSREIKLKMQKEGMSGFFNTDHLQVVTLFNNGLSKGLIDLSSFGGAHIVNKFSDDELYEKATETLDRLDFVGLLENLNESINIICDIFSWYPPEILPHLNKRDSNNVNIPPELESKFDEYTSVDKKVYQYGVNKFMKYLDAFNKKRKYWSDQQYLQQKCIEKIKYNNLRNEKEVNIDMAEEHTAVGFHEREGMDINNIYRWAGQSTESKIFFPMLTSEDSFIADIYTISRMNDDMFNICSFYLNGNIAESVIHVGRENNLDIFRAKFNHVPYNYGVGELCIFSPMLISHHDLDPNCPDKRKKSIAVNKLKIYHEKNILHSPI